MDICFHRAIILDGRIRSTMTISSSTWNMKHQRRFAPLRSRGTPVAHHAAGLGVVLPYVGHRARPVQVGIHRKRHDFIAHIGHISVRSLSGHHRLQVIPQFRQIAKCRLPELNLVYCRNTHRPSYAKYQNTRPPPSARFQGSSQRLV